jgi:hypothetical protein
MRWIFQFAGQHLEHAASRISAAACPQRQQTDLVSSPQETTQEWHKGSAAWKLSAAGIAFIAIYSEPLRDRV